MLAGGWCVFKEKNHKIVHDFGYEGLIHIQKKLGFYGKVFAIWPENVQVKKGEEVRIEFGIFNNDSQDHLFTVNAYPKSVSENICPSKDVKICLMPDGKRVKEYMERWIILDKNPVLLNKKNTWYGSFLIIIPQNLTEGNYTFEVAACKGRGETSCINGSEKVWGKPEKITLVIK